MKQKSCLAAHNINEKVFLLAKDFKGKGDKAGKSAKAKGHWSDDNRRTLQRLVIIANDAIRETEFVDQPLTPEQRRALQESIEPKLLDIIRDGGKRLLAVEEFLKKLLDQEVPRAA